MVLDFKISLNRLVCEDRTVFLLYNFYYFCFHTIKSLSMKIRIKEKHLSIDPCSFELPDLSIITGKNGSGKTHLLQALTNKNISEIEKDGQIVNEIRYIGFNELVPKIPSRYNPFKDQQTINKVWEGFSNCKSDYEKGRKPSFIDDNGKSIKNYKLSLGREQAENHELKIILEKLDKSIMEITHEDVFHYYESQDSGKKDYLLPDLAEILKKYYIRLDSNSYNLYLLSQKKDVLGEVLSKEDFIKKYGIAPWNIANDILRRLQMPYQFNNPLGGHRDSEFHLKLIDEAGLAIEHLHLSTGEKVLLSLALAAYDTNNESKGKPDLLLIDEPDAALHPSMSKIMVEIIQEIIVNQQKIPVVITTRHPTTVIASNGISIYEMIRGKSEPQKISTQQAVEHLTEDVPFLRISAEKRRPVFVESKYDVDFYTRLTNILQRKETLSCEPVFLTAKQNGKSNCTDIIDILAALSQTGDEITHGIIDWDTNNQSKPRLIVLGDGERYAIENYVFDPLLLGLFLIHTEKRSNLFSGYFFFFLYRCC